MRLFMSSSLILGVIILANGPFFSYWGEIIQFLVIKTHLMLKLWRCVIFIFWYSQESQNRWDGTEQNPHFKGEMETFDEFKMKCFSCEINSMLRQYCIKLVSLMSTLFMEPNCYSFRLSINMIIVLWWFKES